MREIWTVQQCADEWDVQPSTWRAYVARGYAPAPLSGYRRLWDAETVRNYPRRGQGARTDLRGR